MLVKCATRCNQKAVWDAVYKALRYLSFPGAFVGSRMIGISPIGDIRSHPAPVLFEIH